MKPDKHSDAAACIGVAAVCLIALTWIGTAERSLPSSVENMTRVTATLASQASTFAEQINRHILALDQTLRISLLPGRPTRGASIWKPGVLGRLC